MKLRDYQSECVDSVMESFKTHTAALVVAATGSGKTVTFGHITKRFVDRGRVMVVAHRDELIAQAAEKMHIITGHRADVEKAESYAQTDALYEPSPIVVASVQTLISGKDDWRRMHRFDPNDFSLLIIDEAHRAVADSYVETINHFRKNPNLKVLGVTATPDRADEAALGRVFDDVAYEYNVIQAINDGWLVPIRQQIVSVDSIDYSGVRTTAGDLNGADLARVLEIEETLHGMAVPSLEICGDRKSIVFASTVAQAQRLSEILNRYKPDSAGMVHGKTADDERREKIASFRRGDYQFFVNVGIATEGFDVPDVHCIVMGRPTKSRALYSQILGRGTRPLTGIVDPHETPELRRAAIAASDKPEMLVLDFVGNSGKHNIIHAADVLGGDYEDEVVELAKREMAKLPMLVGDALIEAEKKLRELREAADQKRRENVKAKVSYTTQSTKNIDEWFEVPYVREKAFYQDKHLSDRQLAVLERAGFNPAGLSYGKQKAALIQIFKRMDKKLCSYKQAKCLERFGYKDTKNITMADASAILDAKFGNARAPKPPQESPTRMPAATPDDVPW